MLMKYVPMLYIYLIIRNEFSIFQADTRTSEECGDRWDRQGLNNWMSRRQLFATNNWGDSPEFIGVMSCTRPEAWLSRSNETG